MANSEEPTLESLAASISELAGALSKQMKDNNVPPVSFAADSPTSYSKLTGEMFMIRQKLLDSLNDMWWLAQGPSESIFNYCHSAIPDATVLNTLNSFSFWSAVPLNGSTTYADIAHETKLPQAVVYRLLQHAMTLRIFAEVPGKDGAAPRVKHTSRSAALAKTPGLRALVSTVLDDAGAPLMVLNEALRRFSSGKPELTQKTAETAFALFHQGGQFGGKFENSWEMIENDGEGEKKGWRQRNFVTFMSYLKDIFQLEDKVLHAYDWAAAGKASVVDIGGSAGHDAFVLAEKFPELTITVQDLAQVQSSFEANRPASLADRVTFSEHSFFDPQPVQADIYLIKLILHDWPDAECERILRGLIPALKPGAKVIILEYLGNVNEEGEGDAVKETKGESESQQKEEEAIPRSMKQYGTATDVRVMALFNAKERPVSKWKSLVSGVDPRLKVEKVEAKPEAFFALIEAVWTG
ncbi:sterigmatocystin 8-O-methyltransferase [Apiospora arundinis]|uniref:Sterigmatocystin 8-O-methyltransferase n=1 Tax=Apiospora arundinis TaxID=335852 RepID=A0ABR2JMU6_9PEZI